MVKRQAIHRSGSPLGGEHGLGCHKTTVTAVNTNRHPVTVFIFLLDRHITHREHSFSGDAAFLIQKNCKQKLEYVKLLR